MAAVSPPQARIARPQCPMTPAEAEAECERIRTEFPDWRAWRGENLMWHALSAEGRLVHGGDEKELRQEISDAEWTGANS